MPPTLLIYAPDNAAETRTYAAAIVREFPALTVVAASLPAEALAAAGETDILVAMAHHVTPPLVAGMPRLRWIQALTSGTDPLLALELHPSVIVTSARGIHAPQMVELALLQMLSLNRDWPRMLANQRTHRWRPSEQRLLLGKTVVIVGIGSIGEQLAARCKGFGLRVVGVTSRGSVPDFDELYPREHLRMAAARADFLVLLTPYAPATHHLIDADVLAAMAPGAYLINLARGKVVDEAALIEALHRRRISGAALDVFATEPLPATSPLWDMDNVIISPHIGGWSDIYASQVLPLLLHNLRRFLAGDRAAMHNVVSLER